MRRLRLKGCPATRSRARADAVVRRPPLARPRRPGLPAAGGRARRRGAPRAATDPSFTRPAAWCSFRTSRRGARLRRTCPPPNGTSASPAPSRSTSCTACPGWSAGPPLGLAVLTLTMAACLPRPRRGGPPPAPLDPGDPPGRAGHLDRTPLAPEGRPRPARRLRPPRSTTWRRASRPRPVTRGPPTPTWPSSATTHNGPACCCAAPTCSTTGSACAPARNRHVSTLAARALAALRR